MAQRALALLAGVFLWIGSAAAQAPDSPWNIAPGSAVDLSISPNGAAFAAGARGDLWLWREENSSWVPVPGNAVRIAAGPGSLIWGVRADGTPVRYDGARWETLPEKARDVAVDAQGYGVIARADGSLARWNEARKGWDTVPGRGHRLAIHPDGSIWTVAEDGAIKRYDGQAAEDLPGRARDIAIGGNAVLIASAEGRLQRWNAGSRSWEDEPGVSDVAVVAVAPNGIAWTASTKGAIQTRAAVRYQLAGDTGTTQSAPEGITMSRRGRPGARPGSVASRPRAAAAAAVVVLRPPGSITDPAPFEFVDTRGTGSRLAIGLEGSVFQIALSGGLARWSNTRGEFVSFPGSLVRLAVDPAGNPWGINQFGRIFRHTGTDWRQVLGTGSDIAIAANGTVMVASATGTLSRYNPASDGFVQVQGELFFLALAPDGTPWGLTRDGIVLRCPAFPCDQVGREARNISIGPDGSVFIVNFANELRRFNADTGQFDFIVVPGNVPASVAVGPAGRPWVITNTGKVLSSRFFPRDESVDLQTASATATPTTGSGDAAPVVGTSAQSGTGFTFNKNMQFTTITTVPPCSGITSDVMVGVDGTVLVMCGSFDLARYNTGTKTFTLIPSLPTSLITAADVDSEGRLWIVDGNTNGRIYRQRQKNGTSYDIIQAPVPPPGGGDMPPYNRDLVIGPDNTAYFIDTAGTLYRKTAAQSNFSKMINGSYVRVAVGLANDVWVATTGDLFQLVNGQLQKRPPSGSPSHFDIGGGPDGSIFATLLYPGDETPTLYKWNVSNNSFDRVNRTASNVDVAPNGRPWVLDIFNPPGATVVYMAK